MMKYLFIGLTALAIAGTACSSSVACDRTVCGVKPDAAEIKKCEDQKASDLGKKCLSVAESYASCLDSNSTCVGPVQKLNDGKCVSEQAAAFKCIADNTPATK
jgi:hypothetical protein